MWWRITDRTVCVPPSIGTRGKNQLQSFLEVVITAYDASVGFLEARRVKSTLDTILAKS
jgi:hypothetical protein